MRFSKLLSFLSLILLVSCAKPKAPEFRRIEHFRIKSLGLFEVRIGFGMSYFNPNRFGGTVKEAAADVYMDSVFVGRFVQDSSIAVKKNSDFSVPVTGTIPLSIALQLNLQGIGERQVHLRADGQVKVGKAGIFKTQPFHYEGRHSLSEIRL